MWTAFDPRAFQFEGFQIDVVEFRQSGSAAPGGVGGPPKFIHNGRVFDTLDEALPAMPEIAMPVIPGPMILPAPDLSPLVLAALERRADDEALALLLLAV